MKNNFNAGFTLLEMMLYIALSIISISLLSVVFSSFYVQVVAGITATNSLLRLHTALDCMARDVAQCDSVVACSENLLLLCKKMDTYTHIGWLCSEKKLIRMVGVYDPISCRWARKMGQPMANQVHSFMATYDQTRSFISISVSCENRTHYNRIMERKLGISL